MKYLSLVGWALAVAVVVYVITVFLSPATPEMADKGMDKSKVETGRWIIYNERSLSADNNGSVKAFTVPGSERIEGLNAFAVNYDPRQSKLMSTLPPGWKVQKELVHHAFSGLIPTAPKCYRSAGPLVEINCDGVGPTPTPAPTPTPGPGPGPTPGPGPGPIEPAKSWGVARVHAPEAKALVDTSQVKVCIVDTGIDLQHPNKGNVIASVGFAGSVQDRAGHGTHCAGTVAGTGGVGVSKAGLLICKGLSDSGSGSSASLAQCLTWCGQQGAHIVSNSWGSGQSDGMINAAINALTQKGIYVFVAAGNDSGPVNWPARLAGSNPLVYAVAASDQRDQITSFSSRGPEIRYISPGAGIISNYPGGGTRSMDGTSMATPHAAGICAFGVALGRKPCIRTSGTVGGYPFADALASAQ